MKANADITGGLEEALEQCGYAVFVPEGNSMLPMIRPGLGCVVIKASEEYEIYDVVLYRRRNGRYILHRIVGHDADGYILCGDHQSVLEYGITRSQILGKVNRWECGKHVHMPEGLAYRIYVTVWCRTFVLRKLVLFAERCWRRIRRGLRAKA